MMDILGGREGNGNPLARLRLSMGTEPIIRDATGAKGEPRLKQGMPTALIIVQPQKKENWASAF